MTYAAVALLAVTPVSRRAHLYCIGTDRERAIGLYPVRPISIPSVDALVVVPPEPLAAFLDQGGYLDGTTLGTAYERDRSRRALPTWTGCRVIADDEVFLMNPDEPASLDGRYFGPIPSAAIVGQAEPIWTFAKQFRCYSGASSKRELFRPAATSSLSFRPTLRGAPGGSISV